MTNQTVIPGLTEGENPESRCKRGIRFWIPVRSQRLASRNDEKAPCKKESVFIPALKTALILTAPRPLRGAI